MDSIINDFADYLQRTSHLGKNTLGSYKHDLELFFAKIPFGTDICSADVQEYIDGLTAEGKACATVLRSASAIRKFFGFLVERGDIAANPTDGLRLPKRSAAEPVVLTPGEINKILSAPDSSDSKGQRDKAMLELMYAAGLKVSELIALEVRDVDLSDSSIYCRFGKARVVPIGGVCAKAVKDYLSGARRELVGDNDTDVLFVNCRGQKMSRQGFWKIMKEYIAAANIKKDVTPQTLRHSFAVHLLQNGAELRDVSEMLGYNQNVSVKLYENMLKERMKKVYKKAHPRA